VIRENIQLLHRSDSDAAGFQSGGFPAPGGFLDGLNGRTDVQQMLLDLGFKG